MLIYLKKYTKKKLRHPECILIYSRLYTILLDNSK